MKVAAFADAHIGPYGKKIDEATGLNARLVDCAKTLRWVTEDAERRGAELLLFAGDMFRANKPSPTEIMLALDALRPTTGNYVPRLYIPGNHDMFRGASEKTALELIATSGEYHDRPTVEEWRGIGQVAYLPYPNRSQLAAVLDHYGSLSPDDADHLVTAHLESIMRGLASQLDPKLPSVLMAHISLDLSEVERDSSIMASREITVPLSSIPEEFSFVVLGHIHKPQDFTQYGRPNVFYTGSTEQFTFNGEGEQKSYVMIDFDAMNWERIDIPHRKHVTVRAHYGLQGYEELDGDDVAGSICRILVNRPESVRPDYEKLQKQVESCWEFRGFVEEVQRVASMRSEEIVSAQTLPELIRVWHEAKGCDVPLDELTHAAVELERTVA